MTKIVDGAHGMSQHLLQTNNVSLAARRHVTRGGWTSTLMIGKRQFRISHLFEPRRRASERIGSNLSKELDLLFVQPFTIRVFSDRRIASLPITTAYPDAAEVENLGKMVSDGTTRMRSNYEGRSIELTISLLHGMASSILARAQVEPDVLVAGNEARVRLDLANAG